MSGDQELKALLDGLSDVVACTDAKCSNVASHRAVHECGWGVLACFDHGKLWADQINCLTITQVIQRELRCPWCRKPSMPGSISLLRTPTVAPKQP